MKGSPDDQVRSTEAAQGAPADADNWGYVERSSLEAVTSDEWKCSAATQRLSRERRAARCCECSDAA